MSAEEKGTDNRGKAVVGKLSTVCEQCPQVSHEGSNKGGGNNLAELNGFLQFANFSL